MRLSETVTMDDAEQAIDLMQLTIGDTALSEDGSLDFGGVESSPDNQDQRIRAIKDAANKSTPAEIAEATGMKEAHVVAECEKLAEQGELVEPTQGVYRSV